MVSITSQEEAELTFPLFEVLSYTWVMDAQCQVLLMISCHLD